MSQPSSTPDVRKLGEARLAVAPKLKTPADWKKLWKKPVNSWALTFGSCWKHCIEYRVDDFASEVGFFVDLLGFPVNAFGTDYAMFTGPDKDFFFSVVPTPHGEESTAPEALRLQFMVEDLYGTTIELEKRGVLFDKRPSSYQGSPIYNATFRTPNGIHVDLWGMVDPKTKIRRRVETGETKPRAKVGAK